MPKGFHGESLREALLSIMKPGKIMSFSKLKAKIKKRGAWKNDTIYQNLMCYSRNIVPGKFRWKPREQFLFVREDGRYELYDPDRHPKIIE